MLNATELKEMLGRVADAVLAQETLLCELDSKVGDGDHGVTMARGFAAVKAALENAQDTIAGLLESVGDTLAESMGGAIGPIFGSIFTAMGERAGDAEEIGGPLMAEMLASALDEVQLIGGAQVGDRTLVDALAPAAEAAQGEGSLAQRLQRAAEAAQKGAEGTKEMVARKGRAKFLQEKSVGYQDAGATSLLIVVRAMAMYCAEKE